LPQIGSANKPRPPNQVISCIKIQAEKKIMRSNHEEEEGKNFGNYG
jgi:hypothetical protein